MDSDTSFAVALFAGIFVAIFNLFLLIRVLTFMSEVEKRLKQIAESVGGEKKDAAAPALDNGPRAG